MKRRIAFGFATAMIAALLINVQLKAAPGHPTLNWGATVNAGSCNTGGAPVINVTEKIVGDVDSGLSGYWAFDTYNRSIQVWDQHNGTYCAVVRYSGKFDAVAGQTSPGDNAASLTGNEDGTFEGGYIATITGTLLGTPLWRTRGNVGTFDYQCSLSGVCLNRVSWLDQYFNSVDDFSYGWWGWIYHGTHNSWVNSSTGNAGDVF
jgi:hypothetical protein